MRHLTLLLLVFSLGAFGQVTPPDGTAQYYKNIDYARAKGIKFQYLPKDTTAIPKALFVNESNGVIYMQSVASPVVSETVLTYTNSSTFTIAPNKKIISVTIGGLTSLNNSKYTYSPTLIADNFIITDAVVNANLENGTKIILKTL